MKTVGSYEAKTKLPSLLDEVAAGATITITKHGAPVASLVPVRPHAYKARAAAVQLREFRQTHRLSGLAIRDLINEGRRL